MFKKMLIDGAKAMGIEMSPGQAEKFEIYHNMLVEANARMNLTRVPEDLREAIDRNYLDCIAPLSKDFPDVKTAVDVGSGAGFPGIPLSIMLPDVHFVLVDALSKGEEIPKRIHPEETVFTEFDDLSGLAPRGY